MPDKHLANQPPTSLFAKEEEILQFWQQDQTFQKSLAKNQDQEVFSFYDGPPFITGTPHYATLLPSIAKDIIPRYQTMKGRYVRRIWGWDTHGLPAEVQVEKRLGLKGKKDIEKLGIDKFIAACREYVGEVSGAWRWYIDHIGRWVDLDQPYRTDQLSYMESVIWVFKQLYDKDLIYRGRRTSLYCPRCATPLSKFEVTMDDDSYKEVEDPAVTVGFRLKGEDMMLLAWTTTPWTLPANLALAVNPDAEYVKVTNGHQTYILAHQALERYRDLDLEIIETLKGEKLLGLSYEPLYSFFPTGALDYKVYPADFVSMDEGTGIVHVAPGFGEDDSKLGEVVGLSLLETIDVNGQVVEQLKPWAGQYYKKTDPLIIADLQQRGHLIKQERITHSYPHCYRCATPLIYKAQVSWYLKLEPIRQQLLKTNQEINWLPKHFGDKRFAYNIANAPDWSLSRTRYWGTPIPVWETDDGEQFVPGSVAELEKLSGQKITDLHRPAIDDVVLTLPNGKTAHRVKEVLDVWFESGSMPYGQDHYPFEHEAEFKRHYPADFIIEYTGQLRGWFYYLHLLGNALFNRNAFKNVVVTGVLMGTDGRKMSKSYGNYPDPKGTIEKYGAEALRLYFMSSKIMAGEDTAINEEEIREQSRLLNVLHNTVSYYLTYAKVHHFQPKESSQPTHVLDQWMTARLEQFIDEYSSALDQFDFVGSTKAIRPVVEDLSTWYIRRNRDRFVAGDHQALQTLHDTLNRFAQAVAPTLPFTAEQIWQQLGQPESVHLADYPSTNRDIIDEALLAGMAQVREAASIAHMQRAEKNVPLRQPLAKFTVSGLAELSETAALVEVLRDEINVLRIDFIDQKPRPKELTGVFDFTLTTELAAEGKFREIVRLLQDARKKAGLQVGQSAQLQLSTKDVELKNLITSRQAELAKQIKVSQIDWVAQLATPIDIPSLKLAVAFTLT